jgi:hypothetical protein
VNISTNHKNELVKEIATVAEFMSKASSPQQKIFYFSAIFGMANRIMNLEFDPELGFIHHVAFASVNILTQSLNLMSAPNAVATFPPGIFDKLQEAVSDLANDIDGGKPTYPVLERIFNLAYSTSGNGYYMYLKGMLKI